MSKTKLSALVDLSTLSTRAPKKFDKEKTKKKTKDLLEKINILQKMLYASKQQALLIVIQAIDAGGKDGLIDALSFGLRIPGCSVHAFKAPTTEELSHDFLWRIENELPEKGMIQIFNRSHYEDVLVTRVEGIIDLDKAKKRFSQINLFEKNLTEKKTTILKFFLHVSQEEQAERLKERAANPQKFWKYKSDDWKTNEKFDEYQKVYQDVLNRCKKPAWTIVPSDQNWYKEYLVVKQIYTTLKAMKLSYPKKIEE